MFPEGNWDSEAGRAHLWHGSVTAPTPFVRKLKINTRKRERETNRHAYDMHMHNNKYIRNTRIIKTSTFRPPTL